MAYANCTRMAYVYDQNQVCALCPIVEFKVLENSWHLPDLAEEKKSKED